MKHISWKPIIVWWLVGFYGFLFYAIVTDYLAIDFSSFYSSGLTLQTGGNPYRVLLTTYLPVVRKLPINLNPPFVLWLFAPFSYLSYTVSMTVWFVLSFVLGGIGARLVFFHLFSAAFLKKNWVYLYGFYFGSYMVISNTEMMQFGSVLLFFIMTGYDCFLKKRDYAAGMLWGIIIAMKFFPALLLVYAGTQKRYRLCVSILVTFLFLSLLPFLTYKATIYTDYFSMMSRVFWYGSNENGSVLGFIFRVFVDSSVLQAPTARMQLFFLIGLIVMSGWYRVQLRRMIQNNSAHQAFCFTLVMMMLMSPFGWQYYAVILLLPMLVTGITVFSSYKNNVINKAVWLISIFLINFPVGYVPVVRMGSLWSKLSFYSLFFYGLLLLGYLVTRLPHEGMVFERCRERDVVQGISDVQVVAYQEGRLSLLGYMYLFFMLLMSACLLSRVVYWNGFS